MALATQCPHCRTTFRVVPDQLKLRAGLVRCGACKQIFNGLEHLLPVEDTPNTVIPTRSLSESIPPRPAEPTAPVAAAPAETPPAVAPPPAKATPEDHGVAPEQAREETSDDPLLRMTLMDFSEFERAAESKSGSADPADDDARLSNAEEEHVSEDLNQAIEDLQHTLRNDPKRAASLSKMEQPATTAEVPEPDFVQQARRQARMSRSMYLTMRAATVALLIGLIGQAAYAFRDQLAAWLPQTAPALSSGCAILGCSVGLPAQIDSVSIESSELQALASGQNTFVLSTLLRNRSATAQTWPHIELTLNDANEKAIVRRVIGPRDYLPSQQDLAKGLSANSEQPIKVFFELAQLKASGYRVYLFYP